MISIDTINFKIKNLSASQFDGIYFNIIKNCASDRYFDSKEFKSYESKNQETHIHNLNSYTFKISKRGNSNNKKSYLIVNSYKRRYKTRIVTDVNLTLHINNFLEQFFSTSLYVDKQVLLKSIKSEIEYLLKLNDLDTSQITFKRIDVALDVFLEEDIRYYLNLLEHVKFSRYIVDRHNNSNQTLTIVNNSHIKKYHSDSISKHDKKELKLASIYDKSKKIDFDKKDVVHKSILRFELRVEKNLRRQLGIKENQFDIYKLYDIDWKSVIHEKLLDISLGKFKEHSKDGSILPVRLKDYLTSHYDKLYKRYSKFTEGKDSKLYIAKKIAKLSPSDSPAKFNRHLDNYHNVHLIKLFQINVSDEKKGIDLFNELIERTYDVEYNFDYIPNINILYK